MVSLLEQYCLWLEDGVSVGAVLSVAGGAVVCSGNTDMVVGFTAVVVEASVVEN